MSASLGPSLQRRAEPGLGLSRSRALSRHRTRRDTLGARRAAACCVSPPFTQDTQPVELRGQLARGSLRRL